MERVTEQYPGETAASLGHILRVGGMERDCLLGKVEGSRAGGRQKFMGTLMENIKGWSLIDLVRMVKRKMALHDG